MKSLSQAVSRMRWQKVFADAERWISQVAASKDTPPASKTAMQILLIHLSAEASSLPKVAAFTSDEDERFEFIFTGKDATLRITFKIAYEGWAATIGNRITFHEGRIGENVRHAVADYQGAS